MALFWGAISFAVVNGGPVAPDEFLAVAKIVTLIPGQSTEIGASIPISRCTGTFISPELLLTAGHCVTGGQVWLYSTSDQSRAEMIPAIAVRSDARLDLAVVLFPPDTSANYAIADFENSLAVGEQIEFVGYGTTYNPWTDLMAYLESPWKLLKNSGVNVLAEVREENLVFRNHPSKVYAANGDSGAPIFSNGVLVGVVTTVELLSDEHSETAQNTAVKLSSAAARRLIRHRN